MALMLVLMSAAALMIPVAWQILTTELSRPPTRTQRSVASIGVLGAVLYATMLDTPAWITVLTAVVFAGCVPSSIVDYADYRLPNKVTYPLGVSALALLAVQHLTEGGPTGRALVGGLLGYGMLLAFHLVSPRAMGYGDVKLMAVLGLVLGWHSLLAIPLGLFVASALGVLGHVATNVGRTKRVEVPFGPYLALGAALAIPLAGAAERILAGG